MLLAKSPWASVHRIPCTRRAADLTFAHRYSLRWGA